MTKTLLDKADPNTLVLMTLLVYREHLEYCYLCRVQGECDRSIDLRSCIPESILPKDEIEDKDISYFYNNRYI